MGDGLTVTALTPWVLWTGKRAADGRGSLLWAVLAGYLCASAGNPYGLLSTGLVFAALILDMLLRRDIRRLWGLVAAGVAVALLAVGTYLPFVLSSSVSYRAGSVTYNDEHLSPGLSDVLGLSSPSFQPYVNIFGATTFSFPALYLSWLVLPLLPWVRWSMLREQGRRLTAVYALGAVNLLIVIGPSQIGFFRWPVRLVPYLWLSVVVIFAVLLSAGLHRSRTGQRWVLTAAAVFVGFWLASSDVPHEWERHLSSAVMVMLLLVVVVRAARHSLRLLSLTAMAGTLAVLVVQLTWMPVNSNVMDYRFPRSEAAMEETFADYRAGLTVQIADLHQVTSAALRADEVYRDVLFGSMYAVADVESLTAYSGLGFTALDAEQCVTYEGSTCPIAWEKLWDEAGGVRRRARRPAARPDRRGAALPAAYRGRRRSPRLGTHQSTDYVNVWRRTAPLPWTEGRISDVSGPVSGHLRRAHGRRR